MTVTRTRTAQHLLRGHIRSLRRARSNLALSLSLAVEAGGSTLVSLNRWPGERLPPKAKLAQVRPGRPQKRNSGRPGRAGGLSESLRLGADSRDDY